MHCKHLNSNLHCEVEDVVEFFYCSRPYCSHPYFHFQSWKIPRYSAVYSGECDQRRGLSGGTGPIYRSNIFVSAMTTVISAPVL